MNSVDDEKFNFVNSSSKNSLPITQLKQEFLYLFDTNRVIIVVGETGSGKTTQIPQYLLEIPSLVIGCTQVITAF